MYIGAILYISFKIFMTTDDWIKLGIGLGGGIGGGLINWFYNFTRNKIPTITKIVSLSHFDLPEIMPGYSASISLIAQSGIEERKITHLPRISRAQIQVVNSSHKDFDEFKLGINLEEQCKIMGFQYKTKEALHTVDYQPKVSVENPSNMITLLLKPFQRKDRYNFTLVIDGMIEGHNDKIFFSRTAAARLVDGTEKPKVNVIGLVVWYLIIFSVGGLFVFNYDRIQMKNFIYIIMAALIGTASSNFIIWRTRK